MIIMAQWTVILFGIFIIAVGLLMLFAPRKANETLRKAGSTNFINYAEITLRMVPAIGLILYADASRFPEVFKIFGWFMLGTSFVLYFIPRRIHYNYALKCADLLTPMYIRLLAPVSFLFGAAIIYCVI